MKSFASPLSRQSHASARRRGFTLIETMIVVGIAGVLSSIAYPSFDAQLLRARRIDALAALMQAQLAQERHRSYHASYGDLAEIGLAAATTAGHYSLRVARNDADGYVVLASANAGQARDTPCRFLSVASNGLGAVLASGPDATTANPAVANRRCWGQ